MSCFQCDLDIPHTCYAHIPNARWGMTDEAVMHLEAANRFLLRKPATKAKRSNKIAPPRRRSR